MWPPEHRAGGHHPRLVRPYVLTRGRTHVPGPLMALEAGVRRIADPGSFPAGAPPESRRIVDLCEAPMSLAEVSARMLLPVGVVRVLVGDLVTAGVVAVDDPHLVEHATDVHLLERLLDGIRAL
ncbi:MAG: DUF742 domain-containing protein [Acidimicrobiia bacterium]